MSRKIVYAPGRESARGMMPEVISAMKVEPSPLCPRDRMASSERPRARQAAGLARRTVPSGRIRKTPSAECSKRLSRKSAFAGDAGVREVRSSTGRMVKLECRTNGASRPGTGPVQMDRTPLPGAPRQGLS
jgi:hypothetical protein